MREVKLIFEDYIISRRMLKALQNKAEEETGISLSMARPMIDEKVQGGMISKQDTKMATVLDKQKRTQHKIKRILSDLKPFVVTMNKISQDDKKLLTSHYIKRKSVNEIAKELDLSITTTRSRLNKAEMKFFKIYMHYSKTH
ncbi:sigma factor-like helix-turn-helix DNA-binding protein [Turicibacter sp.]|uniref:sigma factor-like helix-turn-helix DNA-binding protein n=1 Tax=Turicibacter sp. TaxID=2049042 RepID=UPI001B665C09|nr:sigma factor-like helix-turn-helix DNA-binding protein [Turicibacter sp.]MBP3905236.1 DUF1492 domain-containing protein [Turicibacter sp.]